MEQLIVHIGRTNVIPVSMGEDVSGDTITSQIRSGKDRSSPLIVAWTVTQVTDGTDGELLFTIDDAVSETINLGTGYMDIKRVKNGEPIPASDDLIEILFRQPVTE